MAFEKVSSLVIHISTAPYIINHII